MEASSWFKWSKFSILCLDVNEYFVAWCVVSPGKANAADDAKKFDFNLE